MIRKIFKAIQHNEQTSYYPLTIFMLSFLFWYFFFGTFLTFGKLFLLAILLTSVIYSFLRIVKRIPHRQIPDNYPEWAKIAMRIFIALFFVFLLIYHINKYKRQTKNSM